jgi:hypothetical protein
MHLLICKFDIFQYSSVAVISQFQLLIYAEV